MARFSGSWIVFATLVIAATLLFRGGEPGTAYARSASCSTSTSSPTYNADANFNPPPSCAVAGSSGGSITGLANAHFNQMITNQVLGTVLLVGALTFIPALALGPIVEHLVIWGS